MRLKAWLPVTAAVLLILAAGLAVESTKAATKPSGSGYGYASSFFPNKPTAPTLLHAETDDKRVVLTWQMPAWEDQYPFDIYRWTTGLAPKLLDSVPAGVHFYTDYSAGQNTEYFYLVTTRKNDVVSSDCTAQLVGVKLEPGDSIKPPIWARNGVTPPRNDWTSDPAGYVNWASDQAAKIRDRLPYTFVEEICPTCGGAGIITLPSSTNGLPDLTYCPACFGSGHIVTVSRK